MRKLGKMKFDAHGTTSAGWRTISSRPAPRGSYSDDLGHLEKYRPSLCGPVATRLEFLNQAALRGEFRARLTDTHSIWEPVMSHAGLQSGQTTAATGTRRAVFTAKDVRALIVRNLRSLVCRCPATQQPVDLQIYADDATLTRIVSNSVRFRCPYCGAYHRIQVAAARPEAIWVRPQQANRARHATPSAGELDYVEGLAVGVDLSRLTKREPVSRCR
jgi:hypothetical protein